MKLKRNSSRVLVFLNHRKPNLHYLIQNLDTMCGTNGTDSANGTHNTNGTRNVTLPSPTVSNVCVRLKSRWTKALIRIL